MSKHIAITGANAGIGFASAKALLQKGFKVSMFCRDVQKAEEAKSELLGLFPTADIDIFQVDLLSIESIKNACAKFAEKYQRLDVLLNNAGATFDKFELTKDGVERTMAVNHFGYFLMTYYMLPLLKNTENSRIVSVSSKAHFGGRIDFDTINEPKGYFVFKQYEHSKLANVLFTKHLAKILEPQGITVNCLHPGFVKTTIGNKSGTKLTSVVWSLLTNFALSSDKGAETSVYLCSSDDVKKTTGMYFDKKKAYKGADIARDENLQKQFWEWSEKVAGMKY